MGTCKGHYLFFFLAISIVTLIPCSPAFSGDNQPPLIELQDISNNQTVYTEKLYIAGQVRDANTVETLTLNNESIIESPDQSILFSHLAKLSDGKNIITIGATDEAGNSTQKEITVIRENLHLSQLPQSVIDKRMRIAVYPFEQNGHVTEESNIFMDLLILALQKQNRFQLTDRALMDRILDEQKLSLTNLIDQDAAVKIGKIMSAQAILTGSIIETSRGTEMTGRMLDTETSEIIATEKVRSNVKGLAALQFLAESMAVQIHNAFPMLQGIVIKRKDGLILTDLGSKTIPLRGSLIIYRENDPDTYNTILGHARITQVLPDMSKAELISGKPDEIRELDRVILQ